MALGLAGPGRELFATGGGVVGADTESEPSQEGCWDWMRGHGGGKEGSREGDEKGRRKGWGMEEGREEGKEVRQTFSNLCLCLSHHHHVLPLLLHLFLPQGARLADGQMDPWTDRFSWSTHMSSCYSLSSDPDPQKTGCPGEPSHLGMLS